MPIILEFYLFVSIMLVGLIWTIQIVQYPTFHWVEEQNWKTFHAKYTQRISLLVMPLMLSELAISLYLAYHSFTEYILLLLLVILVWISTFFIQVPLHSKLSDSKDPKVIKQLINSNWIRTALWSIKAVILLGKFC